jgi:hypothetical protein
MELEYWKQYLRILEDKLLFERIACFNVKTCLDSDSIKSNF